MELIHNRCIFTDRQIVRLQEAPSQIPEGETPHTTHYSRLMMLSMPYGLETGGNYGIFPGDT